MVDHVVVVAAYGPVPFPEFFSGPRLEDQGIDVPYGQRLKVEVRATGETILADIIDAAAVKFGVTYIRTESPISSALPGIVFYEPDDCDGFKYRDQPWPNVIRLVDEGGRPSWVISWTKTRLDEAIASSRAGLLAGDPLRPYFWPVVPQGSVDWAPFFQSLVSLWTIWEHLLSGYDTFGLARVGWKRVRRARRVTLSNYQPWSTRLARPHDLFQFLANEPRRTEDVASLWGCPATEADAVLWGLGFECGSDGLWRPAHQNEAGYVIRLEIQMIEEVGYSPTGRELESRLSAASKARTSVWNRVVGVFIGLVHRLRHRSGGCSVCEPSPYDRLRRGEES